MLNAKLFRQSTSAKLYYLSWWYNYFFETMLGEHLDRLRSVFEQLKEAGLKLKPWKCKFLKYKLDVFRSCFIWQRVYRPIQKRWKQFKNNLCQQMLQRYVAFFDLPTIIVSSLRNIHKWPNIYINWFQVRMWQENIIQLSEILNVRMLLTKLKSCALATPVLTYADFKKPFKLHTDASILSLRAVLYQEQDGVEEVISYASRIII